jgi:site-specific DNA-methyltransferase (adenine-specific)
MRSVTIVLKFYKKIASGVQIIIAATHSSIVQSTHRRHGEFSQDTLMFIDKMSNYARHSEKDAERLSSLASELTTNIQLTPLRPAFEIHQGDAREVVGQIGQVHSIITSVPYFHQRVYGDDIDQEVGQEECVETYLDHIVAVMDAADVHPEGNYWINISDKRDKGALLAIPARFELRMMAAGFKMVDRVIWAKAVALPDGSVIGNNMPEPAHGRLNGNGYEHFYRFVKAKKVAATWTDTMAVQLPRLGVESRRYLPPEFMNVATSLNGRHLSNVWYVPMGQTSEKHYAVFPPQLVERPIAFSSPLFVNPDGSLPRRITKSVEYLDGKERRMGKNDLESSVERKGRNDTGRTYVPRLPVHVGWTELLSGITPGVVLDPFCGTGTTGEVALKLGRSFVGIDLYEDYNDIARNRCQTVVDTVDYDLLYDRLLNPPTGFSYNAAGSSRHSQTLPSLDEHEDCPTIYAD